MVKKWLPTYDGHDIELVEVVQNPDANDLAFFKEVGEEIGYKNLGVSNVYINERENTDTFSPQFLIHPTITHVHRHPRYKYPPSQPGDLSYSQIDKVLHVLGDYFPPEKWEVQL